MSTRKNMLKQYLAGIQNYEDYLFHCHICKTKFKHPKSLTRHLKKAYNMVTKTKWKKNILENNKKS